MWLPSWDFCYISTNINLIWTQIITNEFADFISFCRNSPHKAPKWFISNVHQNLNRIHSLRRMYKRNQKIFHKQKVEKTSFLIYHACSSQININFEENTIRDCAYSNSNKLFDYIHGLSSSSSISHIVYFENQSAAADIDEASMFDTYFHSVVTHSDFTLPSPCNLPVSNSSLFNITILDSEVTVQASLLASHSQYCRLNY